MPWRPPAPRDVRADTLSARTLQGHQHRSTIYTNGMLGVYVKVDTETGVVTILRMVSALDCGTVQNPKALQGQVIGGIAQGVGYALYEEVKMHEGKILNPSFTDYKIPTAHEMNFPIHLHYANTYDPEGPNGRKGAGEPGLEDARLIIVQCRHLRAYVNI